jgi:cytochrome c556
MRAIVNARPAGNRSRPGVVTALTASRATASLSHVTDHGKETRMRRPLAVITVLLSLSQAAQAQNVKLIEERQSHLEAMGKSVKQPGAAFRGDEAFDLAKVQAALKTIEEKTTLLPALFPDDSKTGADTEALPKIWDNKADFEGRFKKLNEAAKAAQSSITDEETFRAQWKEFMGNCGGCHKEYRKPKE